MEYLISRDPDLPKYFWGAMRVSEWQEVIRFFSSLKGVSFRGVIPPQFIVKMSGFMSSEESLLRFEEEFSKGHESGGGISIEYKSNSENWVCALYEVCRSLRNDFKMRFHDQRKNDEFESLFYELELVRMPIAKSQPSKREDIRCVPEFMWNKKTRQCGWHVPDFCEEKLPRFAPKDSYRKVPIFRRELADKFLSIFKG